MKHRFKQISKKVMLVLTFILGLYLCKKSCNVSFRLELNGQQWKSTPSRFDNSPPMFGGTLGWDPARIPPPPLKPAAGSASVHVTV